MLSSSLTRNKYLRLFSEIFALLIRLRFSLLSPSMTTSNETASAALARLFRGPNATMGSEWLDSVGDGMSVTSFHRLVVSTGTLSAAKTRDMYGHYRTKTQMKLTPGRYWKDDPTSSL